MEHPESAAPFIRPAETVLLPVSELQRHPLNRPLGIEDEKVEWLAESIRTHGFLSENPLLVRPLPDGGYQIVKGEHRWLAAQKVRLEQVPCTIREMDDTEAGAQLIVGNIQTENKPLEIGLNALTVVQRYNRGLSVKDYSYRLGTSYKTLAAYVKAAVVYDHLREKCSACAEHFQEHRKLEEISRCQEQDWVWLAELAVDRELPVPAVSFACPVFAGCARALSTVVWCRTKCCVRVLPSAWRTRTA